MKETCRQIAYHETIPCKGSFDVIIAGAGVAGIAAAVAAAREGKQVLLLEKQVNLGGLATSGLINFFVPMCNGRGRQIIKGLAQEFLQLSVQYGYDCIPPAWRSGEPAEPTKERYITSYSPQIFALALTQLLCREGVSLMLDTVVSAPLMNGADCAGLIVETKGGRALYEARMVVDATGDADVLFRAGVPTVEGKNYFTYACHCADLDGCRRALETQDIRNLIHTEYGGHANLYGGNQPEDVRLYAGTSAEEVTEYLVKNQLLLLEKLKASDRRSRDIVTMPYMAQLRTTRHIDGDYTLKTADIYQHFDDSVGAICDFDHRDALFEVPLRVLTRRGFGNLITAGRTAAADGYAWDVLRVIPPAILTGQAAGTAAALAIDSGCPVADVNIRLLQQKLSDSGVMIHFDDSLVPENTQTAGEKYVSDHI